MRLNSLASHADALRAHHAFLPHELVTSPKSVCVEGYKFAGSHLFTWVERSTVRVRCLVQEHNPVTPASQQLFLWLVTQSFLSKVGAKRLRDEP